MSLPRLLAAATWSLAICAHAAAPAPASPGSDAGAWQAWQGQLYRIEPDGNLSCYSEDAQTCKPGLAVGAAARPLVCGAAMKARYGRSGYDQQDHWCNTVYAQRYADWTPYRDYGEDVLLSTTPEGDVMCASIDGRTCVPAGQERDPDWRLEGKPIVCGAAMRGATGRSGYEADGGRAWCRMPMVIVARWTSRPTMAEGAAGASPVQDLVKVLGPDEAGEASQEAGVGSQDSSRRHVNIALPDWHERDGAVWTVRTQGMAPGFSVTHRHGWTVEKRGKASGGANVVPGSTDVYQFAVMPGPGGAPEVTLLKREQKSSFDPVEITPGVFRMSSVPTVRETWELVWGAARISSTTPGKSRLEVSFDKHPSAVAAVKEVTMAVPRRRPPGALGESGFWRD